MALRLGQSRLCSDRRRKHECYQLVFQPRASADCARHLSFLNCSFRTFACTEPGSRSGDSEAYSSVSLLASGLPHFEPDSSIILPLHFMKEQHKMPRKKTAHRNPWTKKDVRDLKAHSNKDARLKGREGAEKDRRGHQAEGTGDRGWHRTQTLRLCFVPSTLARAAPLPARRESSRRNGSPRLAMDHRYWPANEGRSRCIDLRSHCVRRLALGRGFRSPAYSNILATVRSRQTLRLPGVSIAIAVNWRAIPCTVSPRSRSWQRRGR